MANMVMDAPDRILGRTMMALLAVSSGLFLLSNSDASAACDIAECHEHDCEIWNPSWILHAFPAHQTDVTPDHDATIGEIAAVVAGSMGAPQPIRCLRLIGHASSFRGITAEEYERRAEVRAKTVAELLSSSFLSFGLTPITFERSELDEFAFCESVEGSDVTLIFDGRGNACPRVDNMVDQTNSQARRNRAHNRRVTVYAIREGRPPDLDLDISSVCEDTDEMCVILKNFMVEGLACSGGEHSKEDLKELVDDGQAEFVCGPG